MWNCTSGICACVGPRKEGWEPLGDLASMYKYGSKTDTQENELSKILEITVHEFYFVACLT